MTDKNQL